MSTCTFGNSDVNCMDLGPQVLGSPRGALATSTRAPGHFSSMTSLMRAKASVIGMVGGLLLSTSQVPRKRTMVLKLPSISLSLLGTSSKVAPGHQATLSVSRAGNSRVCESPAISVLIGRSRSRLAPCLSPGVATLYKYTKHVLFQVTSFSLSSILMSASLALYPVLLPFCLKVSATCL